MIVWKRYEECVYVRQFIEVGYQGQAGFAICLDRKVTRMYI